MSEAEASVVFFDTSALVKRYHREVGSDVVEAAFSDPSLTRMISDIGVIECYSAFARRVRTGDISEGDFHATIKELAEDIQNGTIQVAFFGDSDKKEAAVLIEKYGLSRNLRDNCSRRDRGDGEALASAQGQQGAVEEQVSRHK
jgi:uncharacterized protein with PIN domain